MANLTDTVNNTNEPNLALGSSDGRYPNQFFDLAQQYMPPTIKELFRWCTFYFYNSPLIGSAISKISRYPITDIIIEDEHESVRNLWDHILNKEMQIKERLMEINLDYHTYGNAFLSVHQPFTRFLICPNCKTRSQINQCSWSFDSASYHFRMTCKTCTQGVIAGVSDVPYRNRKGMRIIRWNAENIHIKYNEYTGRRIYMYSIPYKLKHSIQRGDKDIVEDIPMIVIEALRQRRMIRLNNENFVHLRRPTLAEQDQGWGKPLIIHVLKDMFYLYTLRRAQEAIAMEHIVPFDMLYPMPNAQQDPYVHTDLGNWRVQIEAIIKKHRRDPNFKAVMPIPVGFARLGGDGKAMMLMPEMNYLTQTILGGMGIPQEFVMGGNLTWSGGNVVLRTLENDFIQNRSQLTTFMEWLVDKVRSWENLPRLKKIRFSDFRMADDIQSNQQSIGLNAQGKLSDQTLLTELGYDYDQEVKKLIEEAYIRSYLNDLIAKGSARTQGEASIIGFNYQQKVQELAAAAQQSAAARGVDLGFGANPQGAGQPQVQQGAQPQGWQKALPQPLAPQDGGGKPAASSPQGVDDEIGQRARTWAKKLLEMDPQQARATITELRAKMPDIGQAVEAAYNEEAALAAQSGGASMQPMPEQKAPRRPGGV